MSLDWNASACKGTRAIGIGIDEKERTTADKIAWAKTEHVIMCAMLSGLGKKWSIEAGDVTEVYARMHVLEMSGIVDPVRFIADDGVSTVDYPILYADIVARVGLRVNVSPLTRNQFFVKVGQCMMDRARYGMPADVARTFKAWTR